MFCLVVSSHVCASLSLVRSEEDLIRRLLSHFKSGTSNYNVCILISEGATQVCLHHRQGPTFAHLYSSFLQVMGQLCEIS